MSTDLVAKAAHARADGLLHDLERPDAAVVLGRDGGEMVDGAALGLLLRRPIARGRGLLHAVHRRRRDAIHRQRGWRRRDLLMGSVLLHGVHGSRRRSTGDGAGRAEFLYTLPFFSTLCCLAGVMTTDVTGEGSRNSCPAGARRVA